MPGLDVGGGELFLTELGAKRIEQNRRLRAREGLAEDLQVFGTQTLGAAAALKGIEIPREWQTPAARAGVEFDALSFGLGGLGSGGVTCVDGADACQSLIRPILRRGAGGPAHALRGEDRVTRNVFRRIEIFRQQRRRHHERRTRIGKTFASRAIDRKLLRRIERLDAREIPQRVGVFHVRQPTQHDGARIASVREGDLIQGSAHPVRELHFLRSAGLLLFLRRHLAHLDLLQHIFPDVRLFSNVGGFEIEIAFLLLGRVTVEAILVQHGLNGLLQCLLLITKK